ncbi:hypothetical protein [Caballeronia mineralivorans]|jgi:hypothetical protein|uniref:hypothetical protein n=1 Tax=Caballeronia mineralivorans TaxID=2010198 RepID=UPI0023EFA7D7|nr:hypothetical protein [Caballeronia mineralivorans]
MTVTPPAKHDPLAGTSEGPFNIRNLRTGALVKDAITRKVLVFVTQGEARTTAESLNRFAVAGNMPDRYAAVEISRNTPVPVGRTEV